MMLFKSRCIHHSQARFDELVTLRSPSRPPFPRGSCIRKLEERSLGLCAFGGRVLCFLSKHVFGALNTSRSCCYCSFRHKHRVLRMNLCWPVCWLYWVIEFRFAFSYCFTLKPQPREHRCSRRPAAEPPVPRLFLPNR